VIFNCIGDVSSIIQITDSMEFTNTELVKGIATFQTFQLNIGDSIAVPINYTDDYNTVSISDGLLILYILIHKLLLFNYFL
jgi:hypothetical protein